MGILDFLKKKKPEEEGLTKEEEVIAFQIAEVAATLAKSNFETAAILGGQEKKDQIIEGAMPFSFGVLVTALELKGISWVKSPYVSVHFSEKFMGDSGDTKTIAAMILKLGMDDNYKDLREAGQKAFINFIESEDENPKTDYLVKALKI
jgi:hypothetical protein